MRSKVLAMLLLFSCFSVSLFASSCSKRLPQETSPSTVLTSASVTETSETPITSEEIKEEIEVEELVFSQAIITDRVVDINGKLSVDGTSLVNENGDPIQLKGMSTYGMNSIDNFVNADTIQTLAEDWGCSVIRFAMYTEGTANCSAYCEYPEEYFEKMCNAIDLCIDQGVYCIVDWHILYDGDPQEHKDYALDFFDRISALYVEYPNVIYEICNEPNGKCECDDSGDNIVTWDRCIKPYAEEVIEVIRQNDEDNIIIVGTQNWSQYVDIAADDPIEGYDNLMYTLHFYAMSHGQENRDKAQYALDKGLPIFVTEWGTTFDSGGGLVGPAESDEWLDFLDENGISWVNWSIGGPATESSNALLWISQKLTIDQKYAGHWPNCFLSESGYYVKCKILGIEYDPENK